MRTRLRTFAFLIAIANVPVIALAQEVQSEGQARSGQAAATSQATQKEAPRDRPARGQQPTDRNSDDQPATGRRVPGQARPNPIPADQAPSEAGRRRGQAQGQPGMSLTAFLAHELRRSNEAEVELGEIAVEKGMNESVKQFAQMMVQHHSEALKKLDQIQAANPQPRDGQTRDGQRRAQGGAPLRQLVGQSEPSAEARAAADNEDAAKSDEQVGEAKAETSAARPGVPPARTLRDETVRDDADRDDAERDDTVRDDAPRNRSNNGQATGRQRQDRIQAMGPLVPQQLVAIADQACDTELQMTKEMLEHHDGYDFDMAYIGQQIVAHTSVLAKLQAIKNSGPHELQQFATEGEQMTRKHLDQAIKITHELTTHSDDSK